MSDEEQLHLESPGGAVDVDVSIRDGRPVYEIRYRGRDVVAPSPLGLVFEGGTLAEGFSVVGCERTEVDETWEPVWDQYDQIREHYRELHVELAREGPAFDRLDLRFRAFEDGVGFRYEIPAQERRERAVLTDERTGVDLASECDAWWIPGDYDSYEYLYEETKASEVERAHTPLTMRASDDCYLAVHEAALRDYPAMTLSGPAAGGGDDRIDEPTGTPVTATLTPLPDGTKAALDLPHRSPWRTVQLGTDPGSLIESSLVVNLNEPPEIDGGWVEPETYVGIWWEMHVRKSSWAPGPSLGATTENAKRYVDFAADHGISNVLVEGWNDGWEDDWANQDHLTENPQYDFEAVAEYAADRDVSMVAHCETGGQFLAFEDDLEAAFSLYEDLGCSAVKTGYVTDREGEPKVTADHHHHDQRLVNHHHLVAETAAEHGLMLDAHEGVKPTGLRRTYPNFLTRECVRGMEYNAWSEGNPPRHTVVLPFTRMLAGPLDYTPGIFDVRFPDYADGERVVEGYDGPVRVHTTRARQLALLVILFSGLQMAADLPENYEGVPEFAFVEAVPADWDDTRVPNAVIGEYVTVARRHGEEWFVGSATDDEPRELTIPLDFLDGPYEARIYRDADDCDVDDNPEAATIEHESVTADDAVVASLVGGGGHAMHLVPEAE